MLGVVTAAGLGGGALMAIDATRDMQVAQAVQTQEAQVPPQRLIIGLDISQSNPLVDNPAFAAKVAARIAAQIRVMGFASEVHVRTFGSYDAASNSFYYDTRLSRNARPAMVAAEVQKLISGTPDLVKRGAWKSQKTTNILAFLDNVSQSIGCASIPTTIILASDGIEDSEYARLTNKNAHLPPPKGAPFKGCGPLQILGLGQGAGSPSTTVRLRGEWASWAGAAGFKNFQGLNDW